ncbi:mediator of RNA polymerase II transcription subunit 1-domain-containing protein [Aspergillus karnatakaensis]|uniref:RNA polymerase II mediator complex middle subunit MED1 n=1 Tax=Aspergillus karnatakaensis TaxID=1810916 RepID=UPI003CCDD3F4
MATPSSKPNPGATPTYLTSSPRPPGGPIPRSMALKSPSTRTPSASGHNHSQPASSTQQYTTPLAVTAENDNAISFSSPSALLALGAYGGISPSPAVHDALVGQGINDSDMQALGIQGLKLGTARDNDEERRRHIGEVVQLLRARVAGRGVCREGIERLSHLERFESIWQDDNLSIAGNFVDLEIDFHRGQNMVKDVNLNYATAEATNGERRDEATAVLKRDLIQDSEVDQLGKWKTLDNFHKNLQWLARLDKLSEEVNCFEAIEGLYESLKRLWNEEGSHQKFSGEYEHLCSGSVGRPSLHKGSRIGLWLDYWVPRARVQDAKPRRSPDAMVIDHAPGNVDDNGSNFANGKWRIAVECEEGYPSLRVSKDWVGSDVFTVVRTSTEAPSSNDPTETDVTVVNWADPPATLANNQSSESMDLDSGMLGSSSPNRRFVARLEPPLDIPILAAVEIYRHLGIQMPQEYKMVTYDGLLAPGWSPLSASESLGLEDTAQIGRKRSRMSVQSIDQEGKRRTKQHSYTFQPFESAGGRTLKDIPFSHPRQLADILPTLRQYAFLANIIRSTFPLPKPDSPASSSQNQSRNLTGQPQEFQNGTMKSNGNITILSNENPNERKLDALLGLLSGADDVNEEGQSEGSDVELKVDVTLRTQLGQAPVIMLLFPVNRPVSSQPNSADLHSKASINFEIGLNGRVSVVDVTGLLDDESNPTNDASSGSKSTEKLLEQTLDLQSKLAQVLETSQDIGILVEWVLRWIRHQRDA